MKMKMEKKKRKKKKDYTSSTSKRRGGRRRRRWRSKKIPSKERGEQSWPKLNSTCGTYFIFGIHKVSRARGDLCVCLLVWQLQLQLRETTLSPLISSLSLSLSLSFSVKEWEKKTCPSRFGQASHPMNLFIIKYNFKNAERTLLYWRHFLCLLCMSVCVVVVVWERCGCGCVVQPEVLVYVCLFDLTTDGYWYESWLLRM